MFPVTITLTNSAQLNAVMAALSPTTVMAAPAPAPEVAAAPVEKPKKQATSAATQAASAPTQPTAEVAVAAVPEKTVAASAPSAKPAVAAAPASTAATEPATYQDAAAAITKLSRAKGRDAAINVLQQFGASKLPEVKPEQFADIIAAAEAAIKG